MSLLKTIIYSAVFLILFHIETIEADGDKSLKIDIYPGFGWDNLRFLDMVPIYDVSNFNDSNVFQNCIEMIPIHQNKIEMGSTMIDMFNSSVDDYSSNLFISSEGGLYGFKISGSFSREHQKTKKEQGREKTILLRNHIDYVLVDVVLKPSCPLNADVKKDLIDIARNRSTTDSKMAIYLAQLFVKKYGTHFTSRLHLGGSIIEDDFIKQTDFEASDSERKAYRVAAEASFLSTFGVSASFSFSSNTNKSHVEQYQNQFTRKIIHSKGGKLTLIEQNLDEWQSSIQSKSVIVQRAVENMTFFIQSDKIPELSQDDLVFVREQINQAIQSYIEMNSIHGCMDRQSPSFNWLANIDDSSCVPAEQNSQFGGFIRTCSEDSRLVRKCDKYQVKNFYTNTEECPADFQKKILHQSVQYENYFKRVCRSCGFLWLSNCCENKFEGVGRRDLILYGCNRDGNLKNSLSGTLRMSNNYAYGGSFTSSKPNPVTGTANCPNERFQIVPVVNDLRVCLAEIVVDTADLPHYGGIYSSTQSNIALNISKQGCSIGYSPYVMGTMEDNCLLYVCLKLDTFNDRQEFPPIVLPPFFDVDLRNQTKHMINSYQLNANSNISPATQSYLVFALSITAIMLAAVALTIILFRIIYKLIKKRNSAERQPGYISI